MPYAYINNFKISNAFLRSQRLAWHQRALGFEHMSSLECEDISNAPLPLKRHEMFRRVDVPHRLGSIHGTASICLRPKLKSIIKEKHAATPREALAGPTIAEVPPVKLHHIQALDTQCLPRALVDLLRVPQAPILCHVLGVELDRVVDSLSEGSKDRL